METEQATTPVPQPATKPLEHLSLKEVREAAEKHWSFPIRFKRQGHWFLIRTDTKAVIGAGMSPGHAFVDSVARLNAAQQLAQAKINRANLLKEKEKTTP